MKTSVSDHSIRRSCFVFLLLVAGLAVAPLRADTYKDPSSGIAFPSSIGSLERIEVKPYELEPGKPSLAVTYRSGDTIVTAYVRTLGAPSKTADACLAETFAEVQALEANGTYSNVRRIEVDPRDTRSGWRSGAFTGRNGDVEILSYIHCKVSGDRLLKVRCTSANLNSKSMAESAANVQKVLEKGSH